MAPHSTTASAIPSTSPKQPVEHPTSATPVASLTPSDNHNAWSAPGPAAFDLRSDVHTSPTASMLASIQSTSLFDDVTREDTTTNNLEAFIADLTGKPAALLVLSGTMGNQLALRSHLAHPPHSILTDHRSHILNWEAGGLTTGALITPVIPENGLHVTLKDIQREAVTDDDVHSCPTRLITLENTLSGMVLPLADAQAISQWAGSQDPPIALHMDGARIWEAVAAGHGSLKDYCACFDTVSLCFSKGLGAPIGSILVGDEKLMKRARWNRKAIGGGLRQTGVIAAPARVAVEETFLGGLLGASHERAKVIADMWERFGGKFAVPVETNMVWLDVEGDVRDKFVKICSEEGIKASGGRLVVHYQIGDEAVQRLERVFARMFKQ
ncbi:hypothetical protein FH972_024269 [Carpinus fangiana]|uniref:Aromatic amino acid beta-eliminating lyase/threonine aldolase domain-containing protein n=1 Tax=Carpinus fangiana TaxID=176857 RepID=A0A5N6KXK1_9ROSI|nr:hypothetical protein FH972_024269 [Carpinus fangiana]